MRVLVTGSNGFVGRTFFSRAVSILPDAELVFSHRERRVGSDNSDSVILDVTDPESIRAALTEVRPSHILHLAGMSAPSKATLEPNQAWNVHLFGTLNLAQAVARDCPDAMLVSVGSGLVYGESANSFPSLDEQAAMVPMDTYAATKAAADMALGVMSRQGLNCIRMRPFNHTGPGQTTDFVVPAFAEQIARIELRDQAPILRVGNLNAARDFLDVRDVADAYAKVLLCSNRLPSGTVLNVSSGVGYSIRSLLDGLLQLTDQTISVETDQARTRPSDIPSIIGCSDKLSELTGWSPTHDIEDTLRSVLDYYRGAVKASR